MCRRFSLVARNIESHTYMIRKARSLVVIVSRWFDRRIKRTHCFSECKIQQRLAYSMICYERHQPLKDQDIGNQKFKKSILANSYLYFHLQDSRMILSFCRTASHHLMDLAAREDAWHRSSQWQLKSTGYNFSHLPNQSTNYKYKLSR